MKHNSTFLIRSNLLGLTIFHQLFGQDQEGSNNATRDPSKSDCGRLVAFDTRMRISAALSAVQATVGLPLLTLATKLVATWVSALLFCFIAELEAQTYTVGAIEAEGVTRIVPYAVNIHGVVVGEAYFGDRYDGFRWEDGVLTQLAAPANSVESIAYDINDDGVIVGAVVLPWNFGPRFNGAVWTADQETSSVQLMDFSIADPGVPPVDKFRLGSVAYSVNNHGVIAGAAAIDIDDPIFGDRHFFTPATSTGATWAEVFELETPSTGARADGGAFQINDEGTILARGVLGPDRAAVGTGSYEILEIEPSFQGLNNFGHVVGHSAAEPGRTEVARLWDGSAYHDLDTQTSQAFAVNDSGIAVGRRISRNTNTYTSGTGMLYEVGAEPRILSFLTPFEWSIFTAMDINNDGMIVGVGALNRTQTAYWMAPVVTSALIEGTVGDENGDPMPDQTVVVIDGLGGEERFTTDEDGKYRADIVPGTTTLWVEPWGGFRAQGDDCPGLPVTCELVLMGAAEVDFFKTDDPAPDVSITDVAHDNGEFRIDFVAEPFASRFRVAGSSDLKSFATDLSLTGTLDEPVPGSYTLSFDLEDLDDRHFIRILPIE